MTSDEGSLLWRRKRRLRADMRRHKVADCDRNDRSRRIYTRLIALPELLAARIVCVYVSTSAEVDTHAVIDWAWQQGKRVAVPYCRDNELDLFELLSMDELGSRTLGILEPRDELCGVADRWLTPDQIELFLVPGLAFDPNGGRLGHGKGYYDRLLARAAPG